MSDVDEVKTRLDIADIVGSRITLKKAGRNFKALCPFHNEKSPSFIVSPDRQTFKCFGCGKGGSVIDFVMEYEHLDFPEALELLAEKAGVKLTHRPADTPESRVRRQIFEVNHLAAEFYHYLLTKHALGERARDYLKNRGVSDKVIKTFMLGYSPNSWDGLLKFLLKKGYDGKLLEQAGLVIRSNRNYQDQARNYYDRFRGRVMFALRDHRANIIGFSGRQLEAQVKEAKYINSPETPVYIKGNVLYGLDVTRDAIRDAGEAIVMEGEFDVISSFQAGISNAVAIKGSALTEAHVALLKRFTEKLVFALDSDLAGDAAARRGITIADRAGLDLKVAVIPQGKDPDDAVREDAAAFKKAVKSAIPVYDYYILSAVNRYEEATPYGKKKIGEELLPVINEISNPIVQAHYMKKLAETLAVSEQVIAAGMKKLARKPEQIARRMSERQDEKRESVSREERLEMYVLAIILQTRTREFFEELKELVPVSGFSHPAVIEIMTALETHLKTSERFLVRDFADSLKKELLPVFDEAFLMDLSGFIDNDELVSREWIKTLYAVRLSVLKKKIRDISGILAGEEHAEGTSETSGLRETLTKLTGELRTLEKSRSN
jgi:DNA primase